MSLEITNIEVSKIELNPNIKGFAKVTFNDSFCVDGIKIINGKHGLFIGMPSKKNKEDKYVDICYPINKETRTMIQDAIIKSYNNQEGAKNKVENNTEDNDDIFPN